jgi:hypothetical protein
MDYELKFPKGSSVQVSLFVHHTGGSFPWKIASESELTCSDRVRLAFYHRKYYGDASKVNSSSGVNRQYDEEYAVPNLFDEEYTTVQDSFALEKEYWGMNNCKGNAAQCKWWVYVVLTNCGVDNTMGDLHDIRYSFNMTTGTGSESMHIPVDDGGILTATTVFLILQVMLGVLCLKVMQSLQQQRLLHYTMILLFSSIYTYLVGLVLQYLYLRVLADRGARKHRVHIAASVCIATAEMCVLLLLILLAKGWTIVRAKISATGRVKIASYMTTYFVIYWMAFAATEVEMRPGNDTHMNNSTLGWTVIALRLLATVWLIYTGCRTMQRFPQSSDFYIKFLVLSVLWMVVLPGAAAYFLQFGNLFQQKRDLNSARCSLLFVVQLALLVFYRPNMAHKATGTGTGAAGTSAAATPDRNKHKLDGHQPVMTASVNTTGTGTGTGTGLRRTRRRRREDPQAHAKRCAHIIQQRLVLLSSYEEDIQQALEEMEDDEDDENIIGSSSSSSSRRRSSSSGSSSRSSSSANTNHQLVDQSARAASHNLC